MEGLRFGVVGAKTSQPYSLAKRVVCMNMNFDPDLNILSPSSVSKQVIYISQSYTTIDQRTPFEIHSISASSILQRQRYDHTIKKFFPSFIYISGVIE